MLDYQLEINGLRLGPGTPYIIHDVAGLLGIPGTRESTLDRPLRHGLSAGRDYYTGRQVSISITARGDTSADVVAAINTLPGAWQEDSTDDPSVVSVLDFKLPGQSERRLFGRTRRTEVSVTSIKSLHAPITMEFISLSPAFYSVAENSVVGGINAAVTGRSYDKQYEYSYGATTVNSVSATNTGNFDTLPIVTITGPITNPHIFNVTTGQSVSVSGVYSAADTVVVDFTDHTVKLNGNSIFNLLTSADWFVLPPGVTVLKLFATSTDPAGSMTITWRDAWI